MSSRRRSRSRSRSREKRRSASPAKRRSGSRENGTGNNNGSGNNDGSNSRETKRRSGSRDGRRRSRSGSKGRRRSRSGSRGRSRRSRSGSRGRRREENGNGKKKEQDSTRKRARSRSRSRSRSRDRSRRDRDRDRDKRRKSDREKGEKEGNKEDGEGKDDTKDDEAVQTGQMDMEKYWDDDLMCFRKNKKKRNTAELEGLHWSKKTREQMTPRDWRIFKEDHKIVATGRKAPNPMRLWDEGNLPETLRENIRKADYEKPTPIQCATLLPAMMEYDIIGIAETGSGKTAAFLLPMLDYLYKLPRLNETTALDGPYCLIMAPSRELAEQIYDEFKKMSKGMGIRGVDIVGGLSISKQGSAVCAGAEVVIGTPGRLFDCIERRYLALNQCYYVIMDEADTMIDVGFEHQIMQILETMPASNLKPEDESACGTVETTGRHYRNTHMYSATMTPDLLKIAKKHMRNEARFFIGDTKEDRINANIEQRVEWLTSPGQRDSKLLDLLASAPVFGADPGPVDLLDDWGDRRRRKGDDFDAPAIQPNSKKNGKTIVFCNERNTCNRVNMFLQEKGYKCAVIYSGLTQDKRQGNLDAFRKNEIDILIGTDVLGRGIDVKGVVLVVNYDMATTLERYTHRIGRTGRAGAKGVAITMVTEGDHEIFYAWVQYLQKAGANIPRELANHSSSKAKEGERDLKTGQLVGVRKRDQIIYAKT